MLKIGLIALAAAAGALSRYGLGRAIGVRSFPWATLGINLSGSLLLGLVVAIGIERSWSETTMVPLTVGFLGAYTTFSTFSYETYTLMRTDRSSQAAVYVLVSVVGGVFAAFAGYKIGRGTA
jgi:CrcB protein